VIDVLDRQVEFVLVSVTRAWPQAGCSTAMATTAASISGATRFLRFGLALVISASANSPPRS
jgi:hypothetical protein